jgi:hypothetical protein
MCSLPFPNSVLAVMNSRTGEAESFGPREFCSKTRLRLVLVRFRCYRDGRRTRKQCRCRLVQTSSTVEQKGE